MAEIEDKIGIVSSKEVVALANEIIATISTHDFPPIVVIGILETLKDMFLDEIRPCQDELDG